MRASAETFWGTVLATIMSGLTTKTASTDDTSKKKSSF